ncbi:hypothetical protein GCM10010439_19230 [Actinocorallia aurantiaca]|uniref:Secreted protein n=1 Tax=Actinocorallia aurantiaca TaxID=46204 RepID=A0ABN3U3E1_9ACTN
MALLRCLAESLFFWTVFVLTVCTEAVETLDALSAVSVPAWAVVPVTADARPKVRPVTVVTSAVRIPIDEVDRLGRFWGAWGEMCSNMGDPFSGRTPITSRTGAPRAEPSRKGDDRAPGGERAKARGRGRTARSSGVDAAREARASRDCSPLMGL